MSNVQKTFAFREQMRIGAAIANQLPKKTEMKDAIKILGLSGTMIRRIECQALFKIYQRMHALDMQALLDE